MAENDGRPVPPDDEVVYLDEDGANDDVASALEAAARAVAAVEERHRAAPQGTRTTEEPPATGEAPAGTVRASLAEERERAIRAEEEAGRLREALLRKMADFDNLRKRNEREKAEYTRYALSEVMLDLLGVLDNLERALEHAPSSGADDFRTGVEMIARQLTEILRKHGVVEVEAEGVPFDPQVHEAIMKEETAEVPHGTVVQVFQKGYILNDRLLRAARVKVSAAPTAPAGEA
ncbi:MAG: nucleotide exchange factor GrpE [Thermoanaerobaculia bacterium]